MKSHLAREWVGNDLGCGLSISDGLNEHCVPVDF